MNNYHKDTGYPYSDCKVYNCNCDERKYGSVSSGKGVSAFGAILATIATFILTALFFVVIGADTENLSMVAFFIVLSIVGGIIGTIINSRWF